MEKQFAINLIRETFENPFEKKRFVGFVKNLFNKISLEQFEYYGQIIPDKFKEHINKYERIGKYEKENKRIDVLIVYLNKETSIERARTMQRNFVAGYLTGNYGTDSEKDAALVAFVTPGLDDWRFSLVKLDYKISKTKTGKIKGEEEFTPAKRYSFLVGKNEPNHTAQQQLLPVLKDVINNPTLEQLENAFSVETVTEEFISKYREIYTRLKESIDKIVEKDNKVKNEFETKKISTSDFSKKLLGQIVFLYFLQKKAWLGVPKDKSWGDGDKNFLRTLFYKCSKEKENYFNDYLEILFYDTLNNRREDQTDSTFSKYFNCKIPFLNGGLFEPTNNYDYIKTDIIIPNELFSNNEKTKEDVGTGILDLFDRYNFTVREDEPLEKEVALDPELLGKVFENMIDENLRKGNGAFYTPREIVHYMCQESLINYLITELNNSVPKEDIELLVKHGENFIENEKTALQKEEDIKSGKQKTTTIKSKIPESIKNNAEAIDEKLKNIKVCDPAVGSGAFPIGMMHEIVNARNVLTSYIFKNTERTKYNFKRNCIENSLYGVDIDASAIEIAKLRFWLSLIVDEEELVKIKPLPNLDYKLVCGNSLLGVKEELFNNLYFEQIEKLKPIHCNETNSTKKLELKNQIDTLLKQITNNDEHFDFEIYFSEVFHEKKGFDILVGNPPYGGEYTESDKKYFKKNYISTKTIPNKQKGSLDTYTIFIEKGFNLLQRNGQLIYIVPMSITSSDSVSGIHKLLKDNCNLIKLSSYSDRPQQIFKNASVSVSILFFTKTETPCTTMLATKMYRKGKNFQLQQLVENLQFMDVIDLQMIGRIPKISFEIEKNILKKIFKQKPIRDFIDYNGSPVYYRTVGGRYYKIVTTYTTNSNKETSINVIKKQTNLIGCILSSSLSFMFYQIYSNNLSWTFSDITSFTIPFEKIDEATKNILEELYSEYLKDVEKNANIRTVSKGSRYSMDTFKEYKIGKSKHIIDKIDDIICPLYGLTKEETEFVKNYEINFRLTDEENIS